MSESRHLSRAPVAEAAINFQVDASANWDPTTIRSTLSARWKDYPEVEEIYPVEMQFGSTPATPDQLQMISRPPQGFVFKSSKGIYQARRDGFSFSCHSPYKDWQALTSNALAGWNDFKSVLAPDELHGISVRFENRLEFDLDEFKLGRYFATPPAVPPGLNWKFYGFFQQVTYAPPNSPCAVNVLTAPAFVTDPKRTMAFVLDIQVFLKQEFTALDRTLDSILSEMHLLKNEAFFSLLTEEAIQLYI